jgi:hypothetical protein
MFKKGNTMLDKKLNVSAKLFQQIDAIQERLFLFTKDLLDPRQKLKKSLAEKML